MGTESFWEHRAYGNRELQGIQSLWEQRASGNTELWEHRSSTIQSFWEHRASGNTELLGPQSSGNTELLEHRASGNRASGNTELLGTQSFWEHRAVGTQSARSFGITQRNRNGEDPTRAESMACYAVYRLHTRQEFSKCQTAPLLHINSCNAYRETRSPGYAAVYGGFQPAYRFYGLKLLDSCR